MEVREFINTLFVGIGILLLLNFLYFVSFKLIRWKSALIQITLKRIRLVSYLLMNLVILWWFANQFPPTQYTPLMLGILELLFVLLMGIFIIEMINGGFFDYFIPRVSRHEVLHIYRQLLVAGAYLVLIFGILSWYLKVNFTHILTTSAIISVILGLALQDTLGNLFAGLALNLSRPYGVGEWIKVEGHEGKVMRMDWRSISIQTTLDTVIVIPNSTLAKKEIYNYSVPTPAHVRTLVIGVHYRNSPELVKKSLMSILLSTEGVLKEPAPRIRLIEYADFSIKYRLVFWIEVFDDLPRISSDILEKIWYKFKREDISIPYPIYDIRMQEQEHEGYSLEEKVELLSSIDFLKCLGRSELEYLAGRLKILVFSSGERICSQDKLGDTFYIVRKGKVKVTAVNEAGATYLEHELGEGNFFGEISLLTGEPRSASISAATDVELFTMGKKDLRYLIKSNPNVSAIISDAIARRQQTSIDEREKKQESREDEAEVQKSIKISAEELLKKISYFFSY